MNERLLIVNADDFGLSTAVNEGIVLAHETGIVTSASLMVLRAATDEAAASAARLPRLSVGLHLDLGEWEFRAGGWQASYERVDLEDEGAVRAEVHSQLDRFRSLCGKSPSHIDSHQHVHRTEPAASVARAMATSLDVPLRGDPPIQHLGDFYGQDGRGESFPQGVSVNHLIELIKGIGLGVTELACHPGKGVEAESSYAEERGWEVEALCDPRTGAAIAQTSVRLITFSDLADLPRGSRVDRDRREGT